MVSCENMARRPRTDGHCVLKLREYIRWVNVIQLFVRDASIEALLCRQKRKHSLFSSLSDTNLRVAYFPRRADKLLCIELLKILYNVSQNYLHFSQLPEGELQKGYFQYWSLEYLFFSAYVYSRTRNRLLFERDDQTQRMEVII